jgi:SAM-dependent methyltransferase
MKMDGSPPRGPGWLETPLGARFLEDEQRTAAQALDTVFGEHLVQIGQWGAPETFLAHARTQKKTLIDWREQAQADMITSPSRLAITSDSVDAILLPHTLELVASPHALLREVGRVLRADGHLIILSFATGPLWGAYHLFAGSGRTPAMLRRMRDRRLRDWLELLSFAIGSVEPYCHVLPISRFAWFSRVPEERWAKRWLPFLRGGVCLAAQKRVLPLTPVRKLMPARRLQVVGGLVEPTTRTTHGRESH